MEHDDNEFWPDVPELEELLKAGTVSPEQFVLHLDRMAQSIVDNLERKYPTTTDTGEFADYGAGVTAFSEHVDRLIDEGKMSAGDAVDFAAKTRPELQQLDELWHMAITSGCCHLLPAGLERRCEQVLKEVEQRRDDAAKAFRKYETTAS